MTRRSETIAVRASGLLAAAGAYDASSSVIKCRDSLQVELHIDVTEHASATIGQVKFKILVSDVDTGAITTFRERTITEGTVTVTGGEGVTAVYTDVTKLPVPATAAVLEGRTFIVETCGARRMQVLFAEFGDTTNRSTVACAATMLVSL